MVSTAGGGETERTGSGELGPLGASATAAALPLSLTAMLLMLPEGDARPLPLPPPPPPPPSWFAGVVGCAGGGAVAADDARIGPEEVGGTEEEGKCSRGSTSVSAMLPVAVESCCAHLPATK